MNKKQKRTYYIDENLVATVGQNIRARRKTIGLSIEKLANECGIDYSQLSRMELGKINFSLSIVKKVARSLKMNYKDLLPDDPV